MSGKLLKVGLLSGTLVVTPVLLTVAHAEDTAAFYKANNTITLLVGFGPGSGYDRWARFVARYWPKHIPGNPKIVVKNLPGAGSLRALNHLANVAPKDGTVIGVFTRNAPSHALLGRKGVKYDPKVLGWIGSPTIAGRVCAVFADTGVKSVGDLQKKTVHVGGTGPATVPTFLPNVLNKLVGTKFKVVEGYQSSEEVHLAMNRNEVSGICQSYPSLQKLSGQALKSKKLRVLFNMETKRNPKLPDVPSIFEHIKTDKGRQVMQFIALSTELGRPFAAPPGLPKERLAALRKSFDDTMKDANFNKEARKLRMEVVPVSGADLEKLVQNLYTIPKDVAKEAKKLMGKKKKKKKKK